MSGDDRRVTKVGRSTRPIGSTSCPHCGKMTLFGCNSEQSGGREDEKRARDNVADDCPCPCPTARRARRQRASLLQRCSRHPWHVRLPSNLNSCLWWDAWRFPSADFEADCRGWHVTAGGQVEQDSNQASRALEPDQDDAIVTSIPAHEGAGLLPCGFLADAGTHLGCLHASRRIVVAMTIGADSAR